MEAAGDSLYFLIKKDERKTAFNSKNSFNLWKRSCFSQQKLCKQFLWTLTLNLKKLSPINITKHYLSFHCKFCCKPKNPFSIFIQTSVSSVWHICQLFVLKYEQTKHIKQIRQLYSMECNLNGDKSRALSVLRK